MRIVLCQRSTFPVVVGDRGAVNRCRIPFSAQIRSNNTYTGPAVARRTSWAEITNGSFIDARHRLQPPSRRRPPGCPTPLQLR